MPKIFRGNAPFDMGKAPDQSCLCISCEDMVNLLSESTAASKAIDAIIDIMKLKDESGDASFLNSLEKM